MKTANCNQRHSLVISSSSDPVAITGKNSNPLLRAGKSMVCVLAALFLFALCSGSLPGQTLSSGGNYNGVILLNQTNSWTFTVNSGERFVLRGAALTSTNYFY